MCEPFYLPFFDAYSPDATPKNEFYPNIHKVDLKRLSKLLLMIIDFKMISPC